MNADRMTLERRFWLLIAGGIVCVNGFFPAIWILLTSLKTDAELQVKPITYLPVDATMKNYLQAFTEQPLLSFVFNSVVVAVGATLLSLLVAALAAYPIARLKMRYRNLTLSAIVAVSMFPLISIMIPLYQTMRSLGLLNSYLALILPYSVLNLPVCVLMLVSFFQGIPKDLENAAMIDGCTRIGALFKVVLPLSAPGVFTAGIISFVNAWDEFLLALSMNSSMSMRTLPVGITLYQGEFAFPWPIISAALMVAIVPIAVLIVIFQERVVSGLTSGGMKG